MIVHDIEMHDVGAGIKHGPDIVAESSKIGRQDRWGDKWSHE